MKWNHKIVAGVAGVFSLAVATAVYAYPGGAMMWNYGPWGGFPWMWIFPLIFLIVMLRLLFRKDGLPIGGGHTTYRRGETSARELLDRRYASGEVSREEYQQMKKDLE